MDTPLESMMRGTIGRTVACLGLAIAVAAPAAAQDDRSRSGLNSLARLELEQARDQTARDREQAERDREQAARDREQAVRDREQASRDRV